MEELELVTDFASLRAGELVVVKGCFQCGRDCRGMLTSSSVRQWMGVYIACWLSLPSCNLDSSEPPAVGESTVADRRVYRVVIPPVAESREVAKSRDLERVR